MSRPEADFNLVADRGLGVPSGVAGQLQDAGGVHTHGSEAPGLYVLLDVQDALVAVEIDDINGIAHCQGVHAVAGNDEQALSEFKMVAGGAEQATQAREVSVGNPQPRGEEGLAGAVESISVLAVAVAVRAHVAVPPRVLLLLDVVIAPTVGHQPQEQRESEHDESSQFRTHFFTAGRSTRMA